MTDPNCMICQGGGWVCEDHPNVAWIEGEGASCCGGAGARCGCNPEGRMPPGTRILADIKGKRVGGDPIDEREHFYVCESCGQAVDMRELAQVLHHEQPSHEPLTPNA